MTPAVVKSYLQAATLERVNELCHKVFLVGAIRVHDVELRERTVPQAKTRHMFHRQHAGNRRWDISHRLRICLASATGVADPDRSHRQRPWWRIDREPPLARSRVRRPPGRSLGRVD